MIDLKNLRNLCELAINQEDWYTVGDLDSFAYEFDKQFVASASPCVVLQLLDNLEAARRDAARYRVYDEVIAEIDRRAEKEWCLSEKCDFTVTITYEQYQTIAAAMTNT